MIINVLGRIVDVGSNGDFTSAGGATCKYKAFNSQLVRLMGKEGVQSLSKITQT